jgi:hypothetical protein
MTEERRVQLVAEVDTTKTREGFNEIGRQATTMSTTVERAGKRAQDAVDGVGAGADRSAAQVTRAERSIIAAIQRTAVAMQTGSRTSAEYYEELARQRGLDPQKLRGYLDQLRAIEAQQKSVGMTAAQTAAALRGVPAQLTDIVTSLQGGQAPLTVFLQQGGQLRDMFGSAGGAAKALGQSIVGLVNPYTVAAAAVVALGVAYNQGSKEADAYNKALTMSGNVAGTTAGQLADMARTMRESGASTQSAAAEALAAIAGTGKVASANLQEFSATAIKANKRLGQSVEATASDFAELGKSPVQASEKLNERMNYLTASVYAQIKALQDLGKTNEAAEVAQQAYQSAQSERVAKMERGLGTFEKALESATGLAKKFWDSVLDVGRDDTLEEKLKKVQGSIKSLQENRFILTGSYAAKQRLPQLREEEAALQRQIDKEKALADLEGEKARYNAAVIAWMKEGEQYLSKELKLKNEIARIEEQAKDANQRRAELIRGGADPLTLKPEISAEEVSGRIAETRKKLADNEAKTRFNDLVNSQIEAIKRRGDVEEAVAKRSLDALSANRAAGLVTEREYVEAVAALEEAAFVRETERLKEELALTKSKENSQKEQATLRGQIAVNEEKSLTRRQQLVAELAAMEIKAIRTAANAYADLVDKREADNDSLRKQIQAQRDANAQIGMSKDQVSSFNGALAEESALRKELEADILDTILGREQEADKLRENARLIRELAKTQREGMLKSADFERQKSFWTSVEDVAHQTFVSIADGGKSAAQRLKDTFKNIFFDWLYQVSVKKWIVNISAQSSGFSFFDNSKSVGGSSSIFGTASSLLSIGKTIYQGFSSGIATSLGNVIQSLGTSFGSASLQGFGMGLNGGGAVTAAGKQYAKQNIPGYSAGSGAASAISVAGWIAAGMAASRLLMKNGFDPGNGSVNTALTNPLIPGAMHNYKQLQAIGMSDRLSGMISGAPVVTALFGRKSPVIESQGLRGTIGATGFTGEDFANVVEKGGLFRSTKRYEKSAAITGERDAEFDRVVLGMVESVRVFGKALGAEASVIDSYSKQINLTLGRDEEENKAAIAKAFGGMADDLANLLVPELSKFSKEGETAAATLERVAQEFQLVGTSLAAIGADVDKAFGAVGVASLAARERLIGLAGGIEALVSQSDFFSQNFLTEAQRIAPMQKQVTEALAALGKSDLTTVAQFSDAVLGIASSGALATEEGAKLYAGLLAIAPQFKTVADYMDGIAKSNAAEQLQRLNDAMQSTRTSAQSAFDSLSAAIGREQTAVANRYGGLISSVSQSIDSLNQSIGKTRNILSMARDAFDSFVPPGQEALVRANARLQLSRIAGSGSLPDEDVLRRAIADGTQFNVEDFANELGLRRATSSTRNDLLSIGRSAESQLTVQERSLATLEGLKSSYELQQAAELEALKKQQEIAQAQLNALLGIETGIQGLAAAQATFAAMTALAQNTATPSNPNATGMTLSQLYQSALGRSPDAAGYAFWEKQFGTTIDANEVKQFIAGASAELGGNSGGTAAPANTGVNGFAPWLQPGYVIPDMPPARAAMSGAVPASSAAVEARLVSLEQTLASGLMTLADYSKSTADTMEQFNLQGMPAVRE